MVPPSRPKLSKCGRGMHPKPIEIRAWTRRFPFLCSEVPLDRWVAPQDARVDATRMSNDMFRAPRLTTSAPKIAERDIETACRHQRANTNFSRRIQKIIPRTTSPSKGAGCMGEALRQLIINIGNFRATFETYSFLICGLPRL